MPFLEAGKVRKRSEEIKDQKIAKNCWLKNEILATSKGISIIKKTATKTLEMANTSRNNLQFNNFRLRMLILSMLHHLIN
jgi:hypothetical protein